MRTPDWYRLKEGILIIYGADAYFSRGSLLLIKKWAQAEEWDSRNIELISGVQKSPHSINYIFHYLLSIGDISILETESLKVCL